VAQPSPRRQAAGRTTENAMTNHLFIHAVTSFKDQDGRDQTRWTRVGAMFPNSKGGYRLVLELVPRDPNVDLVAMPPREREEG
jgi:ribosomal protein L17